MHAFHPGPFPYIFAAALLVLGLVVVLAFAWLPRVKGWGQIGAMYLLLGVAALAAVVALGAGVAWWMFA